MTEDLHIEGTLTLPAWELWYTTSRSSGAGGQHVNTTDSRVTLCWSVVASSVLTDDTKAWLLKRLRSRLTSEGVLQVSAETHRSQHRNRQDARERLAQLVREALHRPKARVATKPTRASVRRRLADKSARSSVKSLRSKVPSED